MVDVTQDVFEAVLVRPTESTGAVVLLSWSGRAGAARVVQVYVNGRLHEVVDAADGEAGELWLHAGGGGAMRVELLAVLRERAWTDLSHRLAGEAAWRTKAAVALVRDESLPVDGRVVIEVGGERVDAQRLWGSLDARSGFGGLFGLDAFGLSTATGVGHGRGEFGAGAFGADGMAWRWERDDLEAGEHAVAVQVVDEAGQAATEQAERVVEVERLPAEAKQVAVVEGELVIG